MVLVHYGSGWSGRLPKHLDGSLLLMALDFKIWLQIDHMAPKLLKMVNLAQYGFNGPEGFMQPLNGSLWLQMALYGSHSNIWLNMAPNGLNGTKLWFIGVCAAHYGTIWLEMALHGSNC